MISPENLATGAADSPLWTPSSPNDLLRIRTPDTEPLARIALVDNNHSQSSSAKKITARVEIIVLKNTDDPALDNVKVSITIDDADEKRSSTTRSSLSMSTSSEDLNNSSMSTDDSKSDENFEADEPQINRSSRSSLSLSTASPERVKEPTDTVIDIRPQDATIAPSISSGLERQLPLKEYNEKLEKYKVAQETDFTHTKEHIKNLTYQATKEKRRKIIARQACTLFSLVIGTLTLGSVIPELSFLNFSH